MSMDEAREFARRNPRGDRPDRPPTVAVPAYRPFPVDALPAVVAEYVAEVAAAVDCDPAFVALPELTLVGAAAGAAVVVCPKRGWDERPTLWAVTVGDSRTGKSPAARDVLRVAHAVESRLEATHRQQVQDYLVAKAEAAENGGDPPRPPVREYFMADDITIERLVVNVSTSPRGLLVAQDELANWFGSFTRYKGKAGGSDAAKWLTMFDGGPVQYQRRTGHPAEVRAERAVVAVAGGIQPDILKTCLSDPQYIASGLAARLVFAMPPKACPRWNENEASQETLSAFRAMVDFLRGLPFDPDGPGGRVGLDCDARKLFIPLHDSNAERAEALDGGPMAAAFPKLSRMSLRLALIHHIATHAATGTDPTRVTCIDGRSMQAGVTLAEWFTGEAERVYAVLAERDADADARRLVELIRTRHEGVISGRELQRAKPKLYRTADDASLALGGLVQAKLGRWQETPAGPRGGRPARHFILAEVEAGEDPADPSADE